MSSPIPLQATGAWLAAALSAGGRSVGLETLEVEPTGISGTFRLTPVYAGPQPELPRSFILKVPASDASERDRKGPGYRGECAFYASVADRVRVPVPEHYHCEIDSKTDDYVLLLADPAPAVVVDPLEGCDEEHARVAAAAIAGLHAPTWCGPAWLRFPGLALPDSATAKALGDVARLNGDRVVERFGAQIGAEDADTLAAVMEVVTPWASAVLGRYSLLHGDFRLDHLLFSPDGAGVRVADWQTLSVGLPVRDLACFTGTGLDPELRSAADHDLVTVYHAELLKHGVADYDLETCWRDYRYAMVQAPLSCVSALSAPGCDERAELSQLAMLHRACTAVRDLQTLVLVAEVVAAEQAAARYLSHVNVH